eukprot:4292581-Prorocentrum_lima.AAC.1
MTSSLVGSEMCIRDRPSVVVVGRTSKPPYVQLAKNRGASKPIRVAAFDSVSYTHLTLPTICSV